jgi:hypothetical protein
MENLQVSNTTHVTVNTKTQTKKIPKIFLARISVLKYAVTHDSV